MKLYATTTSERASKGQGGNDYIETIITNDKKQIIYHITLLPYNDDTMIIEHHSKCAEVQKKQGGGYFIRYDIALLHLEDAKQKGEKKKGEIGNTCTCGMCEDVPR